MWFIGGMILGSFLGFILAAALASGGRYDEDMEKVFQAAKQAEAEGKDPWRKSDDL